MNSPFTFEETKVPKDEDGFVVSFDADDKKGIQRFFAEHGLVVVRNVISEEAATQSISEGTTLRTSA